MLEAVLSVNLRVIAGSWWGKLVPGLEVPSNHHPTRRLKPGASVKTSSPPAGEGLPLLSVILRVIAGSGRVCFQGGWMSTVSFATTSRPGWKLELNL